MVVLDVDALDGQTTVGVVTGTEDAQDQTDRGTLGRLTLGLGQLGVVEVAVLVGGVGLPDPDGRQGATLTDAGVDAVAQTGLTLLGLGGGVATLLDVELLGGEVVDVTGDREHGGVGEGDGDVRGLLGVERTGLLDAALEFSTLDAGGDAGVVDEALDVNETGTLIELCGGDLGVCHGGKPFRVVGVERRSRVWNEAWYETAARYLSVLSR